MNALIIVDMQVACFQDPSHRLNTDLVIRHLNALAGVFRRTGLVIHIQHTDADEGFPENGPGWQIVPGIDVDPRDLRVLKEGCDAFLETKLDALLKQHGVNQVVIGGCATDFCVDTTIRSAAARGYKVFVAADAHTTADRPHLPAHKIIEHHNYMWRELLLPRKQTVVVEPTEALLSRFAKD